MKCVVLLVELMNSTLFLNFGWLVTMLIMWLLSCV